LPAAIQGLDPGYFALAMATGIVSEAIYLERVPTLSGFLLGAAIVIYVLYRSAPRGGWQAIAAISSPTPPTHAARYLLHFLPPPTCWPPA
jgi:hypothetical protein